MTTSNSFTPGPWLVDRIQGEGEYTVWTRQPHTGSLATVHDRDINGKYPANANARLISAAPDLLASLREFMGHDERFQVGVGGNPIAVDAMLERASAAISKALGPDGARDE